MSAELIAAVVAGFLSIVLEVIPGLSERWHSAIGDRWKPAVILTLSLVFPHWQPGLPVVASMWA